MSAVDLFQFRMLDDPRVRMNPAELLPPLAGKRALAPPDTIQLPAEVRTLDVELLGATWRATNPSITVHRGALHIAIRLQELPGPGSQVRSETVLATLDDDWRTTDARIMGAPVAHRGALEDVRLVSIEGRLMGCACTSGASPTFAVLDIDEAAGDVTAVHPLRSKTKHKNLMPVAIGGGAQLRREHTATFGSEVRSRHARNRSARG